MPATFPPPAGDLTLTVNLARHGHALAADCSVAGDGHAYGFHVGPISPAAGIDAAGWLAAGILASVPDDPHLSTRLRDAIVNASADILPL